MAAKLQGVKINWIAKSNSATDLPLSDHESIIIQRSSNEPPLTDTKHRESKIRRDMFSAELSINDEKYFQEPFTEIFDNETDFNLSIFIEFTIYHVLFYIVLGPFTSFLIYLKYKNMILAKNLGFWGLNKNMITQIFIFTVNFIGFFGYLYFKVSILNPLDIFILFGGCLCRSFVIAIKYALFTEKKIEYVKHKLLTNAEIESEFLLNWFNQTEQIMERELMNTIIRNNIDEDLFLVYFLRPLKMELQQLITKDPPYKNREVPPVSPEKLFGHGDTYYGISLVRYMISQHCRSKNRTKQAFLISLLLSIVHALIPVCYRIGLFSSVFGKDDVEKLIGVCMFIGEIFFYFFNFAFILSGIFEYERQIYLLSQLSNFLATKKVEKYHTKKIFPTINLFCNVSFRSWYSLHIMARDYGKKYQKRVDMYLATFLIYYLITGLVCILSIFEMIPRFQIVYYITLGYQMLVYFTIVFMIIFKGVAINDHFLIHQTLLNQLSQIISDFIHMDRLYFENQDYTPQNEVYLLGKMIGDEVAAAFYGPNDHRKPKELREAYFRTLLEINKFIASQLEFEKNNQPFKVLGIAATTATVQSLLAGIGTAATVAFNKLNSG